MKKAYFLLFFFIATFVVSTYFVSPVCSAWTFAYSNDSNGNRTGGDINILVDAIKSGKSVK